MGRVKGRAQVEIESVGVEGRVTWPSLGTVHVA